METWVERFGNECGSEEKHKALAEAERLPLTREKIVGTVQSTNAYIHDWQTLASRLAFIPSTRRGMRCSGRCGWIEVDVDSTTSNSLKKNRSSTVLGLWVHKLETRRESA